MKAFQSPSCQMSPISGSEPERNDDAWSNDDALRESHNCLAYAMNAVNDTMVEKCKTTEGCSVSFPQPGYAAGFSGFKRTKDKGCIDMVLRMWGDNPKVKATTFYKKCPVGTSKIALIVDPKRDYHYLRQDPDGYWSHKPGAMKVTSLDASGRPIIRPDRALFIYKYRDEPLTYTKFCGYYCVPRNGPIHMMTEVRKEGGAQPSQKSTRYLQTRRRPRDASR